MILVFELAAATEVSMRVPQDVEHEPTLVPARLLFRGSYMTKEAYKVALPDESGGEPWQAGHYRVYEASDDELEPGVPRSFDLIAEVALEGHEMTRPPAKVKQRRPRKHG